MACRTDFVGIKNGGQIKILLIELIEWNSLYLKKITAHSKNKFYSLYNMHTLEVHKM